jgi:hypothetical protein
VDNTEIQATLGHKTRKKTKNTTKQTNKTSNTYPIKNRR